jgi:hypothetical protein
MAGTVSGYGLDDRAIEVRSPAEVTLTSMSRPALGATQTPARWILGSFPPQVGQSVTLTIHPHLVTIEEKELYILSPQTASWV